MDAEPILLDTSLLVPASVQVHPSHQAAAGFMVRLVAEGAPLCISPQVCREFMVALTRKPIADRTFTVVEASTTLEEWTRICIVLEENAAVVARWAQLVRDHDVKGKQVHDTNLVAVMLTHGVRRLATRNATDFERYGDLIQLEPVVS